VVKGYYRDVTRELRHLGFKRVLRGKAGKGSHEKWRRAEGGKSLTVPRNLYTRHLANAILKQAGSERKL